jgi:exopolysaccharide biosynthesis polyprenyl glycosylphosphotransferase
MATSEYLQRLAVSSSNEHGNASPSQSTSVGTRANRGSAVLWITADAATVIVALAIALRVAFGVSPIAGSMILYHLTTKGHDSPAALLVGFLGWYIVTLVVISKRYHLYSPRRISSLLHEQRLSVQASLTAGLLLTGALYLVHAESVSRSVVLLLVSLTTVSLCVRRMLYRAVMYRRYDRGLETRNILIVGTGRVSHALRHHIDSIRHLGYTFKGYVHVPGTDMDTPIQGEILGTVDSIFELARKHFIDEIFFATPCERGLVKGIVEQARNACVDVRVVPDLYDGLAWNNPVEYVGQFPTFPLHRGIVPEISLFLKRAMDITLSLTAITVFSPALLAIALAVKLDSPGPVFYSSERIGKKGRVFRCMKFRTMVRDAERRRSEILHMNERDGVLFKISNDPRITRVGRLLRKYSLDELPQFFNVLRGDMSIVGPRPPIASEVKQYHLSHLRRLDVTPGITGLWQVEARQDPSFDSYISLDTAYVENWNIWLDLKIILRTIGVVFAGTGS